MDTARMTAPRTGYAYLDDSSPPLAFAHRGGAMHPDLPGLENTMAAFRHAVSLGYRLSTRFRSFLLTLDTRLLLLAQLWRVIGITFLFALAHGTLSVLSLPIVYDYITQLSALAIFGLVAKDRPE